MGYWEMGWERRILGCSGMGWRVAIMGGGGGDEEGVLRRGIGWDWVGRRWEVGGERREEEGGRRGGE